MPSCPEMFFANGLPRGVPVEPLPLPRFNPDRASSVPATTESPLGAEMARIFAGLTERMVERYVRGDRLDTD